MKNINNFLLQIKEYIIFRRIAKIVNKTKSSGKIYNSPEDFIKDLF